MTTERIIKIQFGEELRRISIPTATSFGQLEQRIKGLLNNIEGFLIQFVDQEGDVVTIGTDLELELALQECSNQIPKFSVVKTEVPVVIEEKPSIVTQAEESSKLDENVAVAWFIEKLFLTQSNKPSAVNSTTTTTKKWRPNGPRGSRGSGKTKSQGSFWKSDV